MKRSLASCIAPGLVGSAGVTALSLATGTSTKLQAIPLGIFTLLTVAAWIYDQINRLRAGR